MNKKVFVFSSTINTVLTKLKHDFHPNLSRYGWSIIDRQATFKTKIKEEKIKPNLYKFNLEMGVGLSKIHFKGYIRQISEQNTILDGEIYMARGIKNFFLVSSFLLALPILFHPIFLIFSSLFLLGLLRIYLSTKNSMTNILVIELDNLAP